MKIEFIDDECTRAKVTRGWFRRRFTVVVRESSTRGNWVFAEQPHIHFPWAQRVEHARNRIYDRRSVEVRQKHAEYLSSSLWKESKKLPVAHLHKKGK